MAQQLPEQSQLQITGLNTAGHPLLRPRGSSYVCDNFRVMPGGWLRLRAGRDIRLNSATGKFIEFYFYQWPPELVKRSLLPDSHWVQHKEDATHVFWKSLALGSFGLSTPWEIKTTNDDGWALENPVASVTINHLVYFYNGQGERSMTVARPALMTYQHQVSAYRYVGLDVYSPVSGDGPTVAITEDGSIECTVGQRRLWVGLRNIWSGHYSNAIHISTFGPTANPVKITISNLTSMIFPSPSPQDDAGNRDSMGYVFYLTNDGGQVPYMIMDPASGFVNPVYCPRDTDTFVLDFPTLAGVPMTGGVYLDPTKEMPTTNFPPKPMRSMCYVGGRVYGILLPNAGYHDYLSDPHAPFHQPIQPEPVLGSRPIYFTFDTRLPANLKQLRGVVWSNAARDSYDKDFVGVPEESWPQDFFSHTPSGEEPLVLDDAKTRVLVICPASCFLLEETADGIHEWTEISAIRGIENVKTLTKTTYGHVWMTQRKEIVLLPLNSASLVILSDSYQSVINGNPVSAAYYLDVKNQVDRYQVWMDNGRSIVHDFRLQTAYTESPHVYDCARTLTTRDGTRYYCAANSSIYTMQGQPENGRERTTDEMPGSAPDVAITGLIKRNWDDFGDPVLRKDFSWVDAITGHADLVMEWSANFSPFPVTVAAEKTAQSPGDYLYRFKMKNPTAFWYQFAFRLIGRMPPPGTLDYYSDPGEEGNLGVENFYGSILRLLYQAGASTNRT